MSIKHLKTTNMKDRLVAPTLLITSILACVYASTFNTSELINPYVTHSFKVQASEIAAPQAGQNSLATPMTEKEQIIAYIHEVFGEHAEDAIKVVGECENKSWNPKAVNKNRNGTVDRGVFQLNSAYWGGEENFDWKTNVDKAYIVFSRANKTFRPWTCAHVVNQENYLGIK